MANKEPFEQYLSAGPTRIFRSDGPVTATANPYIDSLCILTDRIKECNAKFTRDKSGLRLAGVLQFILKIMMYAPLEGRGWHPLPVFLSKKEVIIKIRHDDERCFGDSILYFFERGNLPERHCERVTLYTNVMFQRHHLDTLPYPIALNDVYLYEDQLQMNMNVFFFDDEGRARHPLVISGKNYQREANLLYWKEHYAPITCISRLFSEFRKHPNQKQFCLRCLGYFSSEEVLARHQNLCTRDDLMSVLYVLTAPGTEQAQRKFYN